LPVQEFLAMMSKEFCRNHQAVEVPAFFGPQSLHPTDLRDLQPVSGPAYYFQKTLFANETNRKSVDKLKNTSLN